MALIFLIVVAIIILLLQLNGSLSFLSEDGFFLIYSKGYTLFKMWLIKSDQTIPFILAFVSGILGISYPLIIQTISNLNDKYQSTHIVNTFKEELLHRLFIATLVSSVITSIFAISKTPILILISLTSVICLLFIFFRYSNLLLKYQDPHELFTHLSSRANIPDFFASQKARDIMNLEKRILTLWHPLVDLLQYSIIKKDTELYFDIKEKFISSAISFYKFNPRDKKDELEFPPWVLRSSYDIIVTGIKNDDDNYYVSYEQFAGSIFFDNSHSDESKYRDHESVVYNAIWRNLVALIEHDKTSRIIRFWEASHQHWSFKLNLPNREFDENYVETKRSKELQEITTVHRKKVLEFYTVLGTYLMYKNNLQGLREAWFFTQSQPPSFILVPLNADEVFQLYFQFLGDGFSEENF